MEIVRNITIEDLAFQVRVHRDSINLTQQKLVDKINNKLINRSTISHLEQGLRVPDKDKLKLICEAINLPKEIWSPFLNDKSILRLNFEILLSEFVGISINAKKLDIKIVKVLEDQISELFFNKFNSIQIRDKYNSVIVYYGIKPITELFFNKYLGGDIFRDLESFKRSIVKFQKDAIRLFSTLQLAYDNFNIIDENRFSELLKKLEPRNTEIYRARTDWNKIDILENKVLSKLGYIAAKEIEKDEKERKQIADFLLEMADRKSKGGDILDYSEKKKRKMDSLLRKFKSRIENGLFNPLYVPDIDTLRNEAEFINPKENDSIDLIEKVQNRAYKNLSQYLTADYMDIYVATSMRAEEDFISVNNFVENLFVHKDIKGYKLRYFNPTQSWIGDRVAKGMVEALMLKRADICIYMAQMEDTFGKDSEASVSLGQGKPVIVYVPKLFSEKLDIDSEELGFLERNDLIYKIHSINNDEEIDDLEDNEALLRRFLSLRLEQITNNDCQEIIKMHWADFSLLKEIKKRINDEDELEEILKNYNSIINGEVITLDNKMKKLSIDILVEATIKFEKRAKQFREDHPLALQVILSTGVLNGIIVVRSINMCALIIRNIISNELDLELKIDDDNYMLIEENTKSTIRVISRHKLISNSFKTFYTLNEK